MLKMSLFLEENLNNQGNKTQKQERIKYKQQYSLGLSGEY